MYWPCVQDVTPVAPLAQTVDTVVSSASRLFGRRVLVDLSDVQKMDTPVTSLVTQPLRTLLQPISDKLARHVQMTTATLDQSTTGSVLSRFTGVLGLHEKSACRR